MLQMLMGGTRHAVPCVLFPLVGQMKTKVVLFLLLQCGAAACLSAQCISVLEFRNGKGELQNVRIEDVRLDLAGDGLRNAHVPYEAKKRTDGRLILSFDEEQLRRPLRVWFVTEKGQSNADKILPYHCGDTISIVTEHPGENSEAPFSTVEGSIAPACEVEAERPIWVRIMPLYGGTSDPRWAEATIYKGQRQFRISRDFRGGQHIVLFGIAGRVLASQTFLLVQGSSNVLRLQVVKNCRMKK